jgi:hypothetical protein
MSPEAVGALIGLAVYFGMRLVDALIPKGRHFRCIERWLTTNKEDSDGSET